MTTCTIVVPCYNEMQRLDVDAFLDFTTDNQHVQFLFVDDGSTDSTRLVLDELCRNAPSQLRLLALPKNMGKAEAVRRGMLVALGSAPAWIGYWDADLATPLAELTTFCDVLERRPDIEVVLGSRVRLLGRKIERRPARHYLGRLFATAASLALQLPIYDTQCGAKLFRVTPNLHQLLDTPFRSRWIFDVELLARYTEPYLRGGRPVSELRIYEMPLQQWHDVGVSKVKLTDFIRAGFELLGIAWQYSLSGRESRGTRIDRQSAPEPHLSGKHVHLPSERSAVEPPAGAESTK